MKLKKIALGAAALALVACGETQKPVTKVANITPNSTDDQKFAARDRELMKMSWFRHSVTQLRI